MQHRLVNPIYIASQVVKGFGRGSKELGIPTANLEDDVVHGLTLDDGIYYGFAQLLHPPRSELERTQSMWTRERRQASSMNQKEEEENENESNKSNKENEHYVLLDTSPDNPIFAMVCSLGRNPQYGNKSRSLEVHILQNFGYDFYRSLIRVAICGYIRPEKRFDSVQTLIETIHADIRFARAALENAETDWCHVVTDRFFHVH